MNGLDETIVRKKVEEALKRLAENPFGLHIAEKGVYCVDGRWWAVLEARKESAHRSEIWATLAEIEDLLDQTEPNISVTAA